MYKVDLNCDIGEGYGTYKICADESKLMDHITSVNIACGFHAGDPNTMLGTVKLAKDKGLSIGAHPGLPDLIGFGRRNMSVTEMEVYNMVLYQIGALYAFVKAQGVELAHVKPHGALYNMAVKDIKIARGIAQAVYDFNPKLFLYGSFNGELIKAGNKLGLKTINEVFADRTYQQDGSLTPRSEANSMITNENQSFEQVLKMIKKSEVTAVDGQLIKIKADTVCIHGDGENALSVLQNLNKQLRLNKINIEPLRA